jgi:hypothetical protein
MRSINPYVVRNGLSDGHGLPRTIAASGTPTHIPIQNSAAGSWVIPPTAIATAMAPYHQARPRTWSAVDATRLRPAGSAPTG